MNISGNSIDFRVSILPSILGEKVALRILDKSIGLLSLSSLGFEEDVSKQLDEAGSSSYGMILACGPTGSGKTKVMSLVLAWSFFHKLYEPGSDLARNFFITFNVSYFAPKLALNNSDEGKYLPLARIPNDENVCSRCAPFCKRKSMGALALPATAVRPMDNARACNESTTAYIPTLSLNRTTI